MKKSQVFLTLHKFSMLYEFHSQKCFMMYLKLTEEKTRRYPEFARYY